MDIAQQRLLNQRIEGQRFTRPEEVVRWMGAMQAQAYQEALWAVGLRTQSATMADVEQAIAERKILRTWPMRGTLHFVPPEDAKWMLALLTPRILAGDKRRQQQLELDDTIIDRAGRLFHAALEGGRRLTRPDMMTLLEDAGISTRGQRGYHLLWYLAQTGLLCLGPMEEKQQTFVLLDEWVPDSRRLSPEEGLAELARRYIASHGPATARDFATWAGLTLTEARAGFGAIKSGLVVENHDGQEYYMLEDSAGKEAPPLAGAHLLPGFDEYLLGYRNRAAVLAAEHATKVVPGNNGVFLPMLVVTGQIVGTWERTRKKKGLDIFLKPFTGSGNVQEQGIEAARRYSDFLGISLSSLEIKVNGRAL